MAHWHTAQRGIGLIEVIVGTAIIAVALAGLFSAFNVYFNAGVQNSRNVKAAFLAEEGVEALRHMRDTNWSTFEGLPADTAHYIVFGGNGWQATTTRHTVDEFTRWFTVAPVYRDDSTDDIVGTEAHSGAYKDPGTRKVSLYVHWGTKGAPSVSYEAGMRADNIADFPSENNGDGNPTQSFTTRERFDLRNVVLPLARATSTTPSDIYMEVRSGSTVGPVHATSSLVRAADLPENTLRWTAFEFAAHPQLDADTTYYLRLRSDPPSTESFSGSEGTVYWGYETSTSSPYAGGSAWRYVGQASDETYQGEELPEHDFSFRVRPLTGDSIEIETYLSNIFE